VGEDGCAEVRSTLEFDYESGGASTRRHAEDVDRLLEDQFD
jgi:hypothetical protein